jgi:prophage tail gpP-like protein
LPDSSVNSETFKLILDGIETPLASSYTVHAGVLEVPAAFEMTIGHASMVAALADAFPAFTPFQLKVEDTIIATGETDGYAPTGGNGSELIIRGRDMLKWLVDTRLDSERTFAEKTYLDLTEIALQESGLGERSIFASNTANRKAITGSTQVKELVPVTTEETQTEVGNATGKTKTVYKTIKGEIGTTWFELLKEQYKRAGLFLWSTVNGDFVLSRPNGEQAPLYRILRRRGKPEAGEVTVLGQPSFNFDATERYTECFVTGHAGGGKNGRGKVSGRAYDKEMIALLNPLEADQANGGKRKKVLPVKDDKCRTKEQCEFLARRKIAESRRNGWELSYTVTGHTAPALLGGGRAIWAPDTVVHVIDDELGIDGPMYVESCVYKRDPKTTTTLNLLRVEDLVFAEEDVDNPPKLAKKKGIANVRVGKTEVYRVQAQWRRDPNVWGGLPLQVRDDFVGVRSGAIGPPTAGGDTGEEQFIEDIGARRLR